MRRREFLLGSVILLPAMAVLGAEKYPRPGRRDLCPVCGMLVAKYPNWVAGTRDKTGRVRFFDGAKDLFKYLKNVTRYDRDRKPEDILHAWVTEYYGLTQIDARHAFFVIGSDVLGPMGHELVPLDSRASAEEFLGDHKGRRILRFEDVTTETAVQLDAGKFE